MLTTILVFVNCPVFDYFHYKGYPVDSDGNYLAGAFLLPD